MQVRHRFACLSAAVLAALYGGATAQARDLVWDANGAAAPVGQDGAGDWSTDAGNLNWVENFVPGDPATGTNVVWSNGALPGTLPDSAQFGNLTTNPNNNAPGNFITLMSDITVQNLVLGTSAAGGYYSIQDDFFSTHLTLNGNVTKASQAGGSQIFLGNGLGLTAGNHTFAIQDTGGDAAPELTVNSVIYGPGGVTLDNGTYAAWGTLAFNFDNTYAGQTNIVKGRLITNTSNGLGSTAAGTLISDAGTLAFGGAGTKAGDLTINEAITIRRNTYAGGDFGLYGGAVVATNDGDVNTITLAGAVIVDSTDARVQVNTNRVIIPNALQVGSTVAANSAVFTAAGDFAGYLRLTGDNTTYSAAGGAFRIVGGVELEAASEANIGGPTSKLYLSGGTIRPTGTLGASGSAFMTNFGAHDLSGAPINTGLNLDAGQVFTVNNLGGTAIGTRGTGTINFNGTNAFTGAPFFDGGVVNINGTTSVGGVRLRNATLNVNNGATFSTTNSYSSIALDNGENATVNLNGNAVFTAFNADFNVSDNAGSTGTLNIRDTSSFTAAGLMFVGKNSNAVGTVNQSGGSLTLTRNGDFTFVLGDGRGGRTPVGNYNFSGGTFTSAGEVFVGEGNTGTGNWNQTGGTATVNNWFVVGREGGLGKVDLSGGIITKAGGGDTEVDAQGGLGTSTMTVRNAAEYRAQTGTFKVGQLGGGSGILNVRDTGKVTVSAGEFWIGNGGATGVVNIQDSASLTVSNWLAIGRGGSSVGNLNVSGGTVTKTAGSGGFLAVGSGGTGTLTQTGGTMNIFGTRLAEATDGTMNLSGGVATFTGDFSLGHENNRRGTLNISGTANVTVPNVVFGVVGTGTGGGTINLDGGTLTGGSFTGGANSVGAKTFNFNGGSLVAAADSATFIGPKITGVVRAGGAKINSNGKAVTIGAALTHDAALGGTADGGLTKSGEGTLALTGVNTYTGNTVVQAGTLSARYASAAPSAATPILAGPGFADLQGGRLVLDYAGDTSPAAAVRTLLAAGRPSNFASGQIRSTPNAADPARGIGYGELGGSQLQVRSTFYGDATLDGVVDVSDLGSLATGFGTAGDAVWTQGDFNYDANVDVSDLGLLATYFGRGTALTAAAAAERFRLDFAAVLASNPSFAAKIAGMGGFDPVAAVPEPATLAAAAAGLAALAGRRRRRPVAAAG